MSVSHASASARHMKPRHRGPCAGFRTWHKLSNALTSSVTIPIALLIVAPSTVFSQTPSFYAVRVNGTWVQHSRSGSGPLASLARIPSDAMLELVEGSATDTTLSVSIRNPRTLGLATLACRPATPCRGRIPVSSLKFERSGPEVGAVVEGLYHGLGSDEPLRSRIRLVGARGDARGFGILVLAVNGGTIDLTELRQRVGDGADGAVVRFCNLAAGSTWDDCLESRQLLPGDCSLDQAVCSVGLEPGAYRADLYDRDRRMLRSVPRGAGFAAVVVQNKLSSAKQARDSIESALRQISVRIGHDEVRALEGAAVRALAVSSR